MPNLKAHGNIWRCEAVSQLLRDHISRKHSCSSIETGFPGRVLTVIQNASKDTYQAACPPRLRFTPYPPHLSTRNRDLRLGSSCLSDDPRTSHSADTQSRAPSATIPAHPTALSQAAGGPQNATAPAVSIAPQVLAFDFDIPAQQRQSGRMDEHKKGIGHCTTQAGCGEGEEWTRDACR